MKRVSLWLGFFVGFAISALTVGIVSGYWINRMAPSKNLRQPSSVPAELSPAPEPMPRLRHAQ